MTSDDVNKAKPDSEIVLKACKRLKVEPKDVVLVGDTDSDVKAGRATGCSVIGLGIKADFFINNLSEITDILV